MVWYYRDWASIVDANGLVGFCHWDRGYPAKRALSAMRKHGV